MTPLTTLGFCQGYSSLFDLSSIQLLAAGGSEKIIVVAADAALIGVSMRSMLYLTRLMENDGLIELEEATLSQIKFSLTAAGLDLKSKLFG